jgi:hypothetical protein
LIGVSERKIGGASDFCSISEIYVYYGTPSPLY